MPENRLFIKITREILPQVKDKYPFIYLEHGRVEIDDSSIKWISADGEVIRIPAAMLSVIFLGPGTSITHEAVKVLASSNCRVCWVGEDSLRFYAFGETPTADTKNIKKQIRLASDKKRSLEIARKLFSMRFPDNDVSNKTLKELMGMEGYRIRNLYELKAQEYKVGWKGRRYVPGQLELSDVTNKYLTICNAMLYGILSSVIWALGYTPHVGFIHSGSPLPFVYDMADIYKADICIDTAFYLTKEYYGQYDRSAAIEEFRRRAIEMNLLKQIVKDIDSILGGR